MLGTSGYAVVITDRVGRVLWQSTDRSLEQVEWRREYCETSACTVNFTARPHVVDALEPWVHLVNVYRMDGDVLCWRGVVRQVKASRAGVQVTAYDGSVYWGKRRVSQKRDYRNRDAAQVARDVVQDGMGMDDPLEMASTLVAGDSLLWQTVTIPVATRLVQDVMDDLTGDGLAWTVSAGRLILGPVPAQHTTLQITDDHWTADVVVVKEGADTLTDVMLTGKGARGYWADHDTPVGWLQATEKADGLVREDECVAAARRMVEEAKYPPRRVMLDGDARLLPGAPVDINELIPGVLMPVSSNQTGVTVGSTLALQSVQVIADSSGEAVQVELMEVPSNTNASLLPPPVEEDYSSPYDQERRAKEQAEGADGGATEDTGVGPA